MKKFFIISAIVSATATASFSTAYAAPSCEDGLKAMEESLKIAKLSDADTKAVTDLKAKATERCLAEDDRRAEGFIADAMKIITKK